jgi:SAM-dependent methyltransferase
VKHAQLVPGDKVLEAGCAAGFFTSNYIDRIPRGVHVTAIDISPECLRRAMERVELANRPNLRFVAHDLAALPYTDDSFDAIVGSSILHHIDLSRCLPELRRVLKPGGRFVFAEPNALNPIVVLQGHFGRLRRRSQWTDDEKPISRFRLARTLRRHGFNIDRIYPFDFLHPQTPFLLQGTVQRLGQIPEAVPFIREVAGSMVVAAHKPSTGAGLDAN